MIWPCHHTSTPTVLPVCRKPGYDGYRQFKRPLLLELENEKPLPPIIICASMFKLSCTLIGPRLFGLFLKGSDLGCTLP